jgi:hypothetical protein
MVLLSIVIDTSIPRYLTQTKQTPNILEAMSDNINKDRDEKLAEEPVNNPAERTLASPDDARVLPLTILSTSHAKPHEKSLPLTPWNQNARIERWIEAFSQDLGEGFMRDVERALEEGVLVGGKLIK